MSGSKVLAGLRPVEGETPTRVVQVLGWPASLAEVSVISPGPVRFHPSLQTAAELDHRPSRDGEAAPR